jgi:serine/threonine-protein kinase
MPIDSVPALISALRESHSLAPARMEEVASTLQGRFQSPRLLAKELLQRGWLTAFQLNKLFQGRVRELIVGPYVLLERIGEGGMGQVFKAWHRHMDRIVALKIIRKDRLDNPETARRFLREIEVAARLSHPNIVAAYDAGEVGGTRYIALEYVEGIDLAKLVKQSGPLPVDQACDSVRQTALGLQHAFERGLVHRDIKPSNLLLTGARGEGRGAKEDTGAIPLAPRSSPLASVIKILDMGLARLQSSETEAENITEFQATLGTPDFISPEQARDARSADIRADLYSLGCTFYFLLTGKVPFPSAAPMEKLLKHWMEQPTAIEELRPEVSSEVADIVRKLMAKRPEDRYQTPIELIAALSNLSVLEVPPEVLAVLPPARPKSDPHRPGRVPTPMQETVVPSSVDDTAEGPIIRVEIARPSRRAQMIQLTIASIAVAVLTVLLVMLLRLQ